MARGAGVSSERVAGEVRRDCHGDQRGDAIRRHTRTRAMGQRGCWHRLRSGLCLRVQRGRPAPGACRGGVRAAEAARCAGEQAIEEAAG
jgi:hypothetical protein